MATRRRWASWYASSRRSCGIPRDRRGWMLQRRRMCCRPCGWRLVRKSDTITEPLAVLQWMVVSTKREAWRVAKNQGRFTPEDLESTAVAANDTVSRSRTRSSATRATTGCGGTSEVARALPDAAAGNRLRRPTRLCRTSQSAGDAARQHWPYSGRCLAKLRIALAQDPTWEHQ